jgi:glycosyltransferase involved in cell wall biosynthesis
MGSPGNSVAVIPVHNEAPTISAIVAEACAYLPVIVVDDASDDGSGALAAAVGATVLTLPRHQGKGAALRYGFAEALRRHADAVVTLDGDGQHDPQDIPRLLAASRCWPESIVIGGRLAAAAEIPRHRLHAIRVASFWINWLGGCNVQDTQSGFRVYPASVLRSLPLKRGRFLLESEVLLKASQMGYALRELPIRAIYRPGQRSQYHPVRDGTTAVIYLLSYGIRCWPRHIRRCLCTPRSNSGVAREPTPGSMRVAALATGLLPVLFLAMLVQLLCGRVGCDILAPLIRGFYDQRLLQNSSGVRKMRHAQQPKQWECV